MNTQGLPQFENTQKAFEQKNNSQLRNSYWLFRLMGQPALVKVFSKATLWALKMGLPIGGLIKSTIFKQFCGGESLTESQQVIDQLQKVKVGAILDYSIEGKESEEDFEATKNELLRIIRLAKNNPAIPYTSIKLTGVARFALLEKVSGKVALSEEEKKEYALVLARIDEICKLCKECHVPIYIDAEETWVQDAIDGIAEEMMLKYNTEYPIVQTTLQMYRWDRITYLKKIIAQALSSNIIIGVKLVRGAYWEKENLRAQTLNYKSPMHQQKVDTDKDYDDAVTMCLENISHVSLCVGTHNEQSTLHLARMMTKLGIAPNDKRVYSSQLFGMSDHITYNVADAGFNVTKYLPYGPVKSVMPYLIRRAEENTSIAGQMGRELRLILTEKKRRSQV